MFYKSPYCRITFSWWLIQNDNTQFGKSCWTVAQKSSNVTGGFQGSDTVPPQLEFWNCETKITKRQFHKSLGYLYTMKVQVSLYLRFSNNEHDALTNFLTVLVVVMFQNLFVSGSWQYIPVASNAILLHFLQLSTLAELPTLAWDLHPPIPQLHTWPVSQIEVLSWLRILKLHYIRNIEAVEILQNFYCVPSKCCTREKQTNKHSLASTGIFLGKVNFLGGANVSILTKC